jgi:hypothetical protein
MDGSQLAVPDVFSSTFDRRRAKRVQPGPLAVALYGQDGVLLDVSETGALFKTDLARPYTDSLTFALQWGKESLSLRGRVVRAATQHLPPAPDSALPRVEHHVAVEFQEVPAQTIAQLRRLVRAEN